MFHAENRALQDRFGSRALADRLVETRRFGNGVVLLRHERAR